MKGISYSPQQHSKISKLFLGLLVVSILGILIPLLLAIKSPMAFQKSNLIVIDSIVPLELSRPKTDVIKILQSIPYVKSPKDVISIDPKTKYKKTILGGDGNCSNLAFGLSYEFINTGQDFEIIHFLGPGFMEGQGHTVMRLPFDYNGVSVVGLIDVLNGGIPVSTINNTVLDVQDLHSQQGKHIVQLNDRRKPQDVYYSQDYLNDKRFGYISPKSVQSYFQFIEQIYIPLGNEKIEKYLYDGVALLFGYLPEIKVDQSTYDYLYINKKKIRNLNQFALLLLRISISLFLLLTISYFIKYISSKRASK